MTQMTCHKTYPLTFIFWQHSCILLIPYFFLIRGICSLLLLIVLEYDFVLKAMLNVDVSFKRFAALSASKQNAFKN